MVIKLSGRVLDQPTTASSLWSVIASASKNRPIVLMHGGGKQVDALLHRLGEQTTRVDGIRVTPDSQIDLVSGVLAGQVSLRLVGALKAAGAAAVGLSLGDAGMLECRQADPDLGRVGMLQQTNAELLGTLLAAEYLPVVNSIGLDKNGGPLNVNADDAAVAIAVSLGASELLYISDVPGLLDEANDVIATVNHDQVETLVHGGVAKDGMAAKLRSASDALGGGVDLVRLTDTDGAIKRLMGESFTATRIHMESRLLG
ncbi:MAG: acetylglutamate kinase [Phycisphaera sp.]|nr:MAG: acetylglutamate kinase [Phycisphaera sp.]